MRRQCGCCSSVMTGPRTTTTSRSSTSTGRRLVAARLPEGMAGMTRLHALIAEHLRRGVGRPETRRGCAGRVKVGIETDRGPWVAALVAAGYEVFAINPMSVARYRERHSHVGGEVRSRGCARAGRDRAAGPGPSPPGRRGLSAEVEAIKLVARTHQSLIWDRTRHVLRLRSDAAGVLPRRAGRLRAIWTRPGRARAARGRPGSRTGRPGCRSSKITAALQPGPPPQRRGQGRSRSRPRCAPRRCGSPPRSRPPTPRSPPARSG